MMKVALVSCVKSKLRTPAAACELYTSHLFRSLRRYAEACADRWYILSAEHGLLEPDQIIAPYERTLNRMSREERRAWAERVKGQLVATLPAGAEVIILAGFRYREELVPFLQDRGFMVTIPLEGLRFGEQLQRLKALNSADGTSAVDRFYDIISTLAESPGQGLRLGEYTGASDWPARGVYFFLEPGESRRASPSVPRVVRIGTHAVSAGARSTLWRRLRAHRGREDGSGNHRGSIFRLHVGAALLRRGEGGEVDAASWGIGRQADRSVRTGEAGLEQRVSEHIRQMRVLWVRADDDPGPESLRAFIERNSIALLSNRLEPHDPPSSTWLGLHSPRDEIRMSGLWNLNHVRDEVDLSFLEVFERLVHETISGAGVGGSRDSIHSRDPAEDGSRTRSHRDRATGPEQDEPGDQAPDTPTRLTYATRSRFLSRIESALSSEAEAFHNGGSVAVFLGSGGYEGEYLVRIDQADREVFETDWRGKDETRFSARIRAAATALRNAGYVGSFVITHRGGLLAIRLRSDTD